MKEREDDRGIAYFARLPRLIQNQAVENGIPINSKSALENFYRDILNSGPQIVPMDDELIDSFH